MDALWYAIVSGMLAAYVVLDGFDFGAGILHRFVARTDEERRTVLAAIGPVWDGNETILVASGGVLFLAFPKTYASAFSGFYMALMIVLWLLILRGIAIAFRSAQDNPLWREFWDTTFALASALLAVVLGTSLANVVRGVPVGESGFFSIGLFTNFLTGKQPGIFDWYTTLVGLFALAALASHGAFYLAWRTTGPVQQRSWICARNGWLAVLPLWVLATAATAWVQPDVFKNLLARPWSLAFVLLMLAGFWGGLRFLTEKRELLAFLSSSAFLVGLLGATLAGNYPYWLRSTIDPAYSLTATNTVAESYGLRTALAWWTIGITLAVGYFTYLFRSIRGKVVPDTEGH